MYAYSRGKPVLLIDPGGTKAERSPYYEQRSLIEQTKQEATNIRGLISNLELEKQGGEDVEGISAEIAELEAELAKVDQRVRVEKAVLAVAKDADPFLKLARLRGFSASERGDINARSSLLNFREEMFARARQHVARAPTARERGEMIREQQQEARWTAMIVSVSVLLGIETVFAARASLVAVEARVAATGASAPAAATGGKLPNIEGYSFSGPRAARAADTVRPSAAKGGGQGKLLPGPRIRISDEQFGKKVAKHAGDFGLEAGNPAHRQLIRDRIEQIVGRYDEVRQGPFNPRGGGGSDYLFYRQGEDLVITKPSGEFVTVLPGGASTSGWFSRATALN